MKKIVVLACLLCIYRAGFGQASEGSVENPKLRQPAAIAEMPFSALIVTAALNDYMTRSGKTGGDNIKGYACYKDKKLNNELLKGDLYFKVETKSKKEQGQALVSLLLSSPVQLATSSSLTMEQAKAILDALAPAVAAFNNEVMIRDQSDAVGKAESRYNSIRKDTEDLENKKVKIEKELQENNNKLQKQQDEVNVQKEKLAELVSKRKS